MPAPGRKRSLPKYMQHDNVRKILGKIGIEENMRTATMLFDWAVGGEIENLSAAIARGYSVITKTQSFTKLRDLLKEGGWIDFSEPEDKSENAFVRYKIGAKFLKYVNKELASRSVIATRKDIENVTSQTNEKFKAIDERFEKLENLVRLMIAKTNPPVTDTKLELAINDPEKYLETFFGTWATSN